jgi:hypothetical protein
MTTSTTSPNATPPVVSDPQPPVLEIRIHGVSNTPPQFVLGRTDPADIDRVVGDESTAFYRAKGAVDPLLDTQAYSWGQLTSGIRTKKDLSRGLWMLLLPFALVNVGFWARWDLPEGSTWNRSRSGGPASFVMRLFALSLTVTLSLAATGLSVDLVAWQWLHITDPQQIRWISQLEFLRAEDGMWSSGYRPFAVALALPFAVLLLIWVVARRSFQYEAEVSTAVPPPADVDPDQEVLTSPLDSKWFWRGSTQVRRLAFVHLLAGAAAACLLTIAAAPQTVFSTVVACSLVAVLLGCVAVLALPAVTVRCKDSQPKVWARASGALVVVVAFAVIGTVVHLMTVPGRVTDHGYGDLRAFGETVLMLFAGQFLVLVGLAAGQRWKPAWVAVASVVLVAVYWLLAANIISDLPLSSRLKFANLPGDLGSTPLRAAACVAVPLLVLCILVGTCQRAELRNALAPGIAWRAMAGPLLMMLGWLLALLYSAGILFFAADWLSDGKSLPNGMPPVQLPLPFQWAALGLPIAVAALVVTGVVVWILLARGRKPCVESVMADYRPADGRPMSLHEESRSRTVATRRAFHFFMQERLLTTIGWLGLVVLVEVVVGLSAATTWQPVESLGSWAVALRDVGVRLSLLLLLGIVLAGVLVYRADPRRRGIAIVWDLATFWPRAGHPLSPPCYAERCVPQLVTRLCNDTPGRRGYVLSGHSQGAVLAVATLLQLPQERVDRVFLLTYGTQLRYLYGRVFPRFFGTALLGRDGQRLRRDQLAYVAGRLTGAPSRPDWLRWHSFVRLTDPLGYPVEVSIPVAGTPVWVDNNTGDGALAPLRDPAAVAPPPGDIEDPPIRGHSDYYLDPTYETVTREAAQKL